MGKETTKLRILSEGARIIYKNGYNNTGIQEILDAAGVPKGSLYFYFKSKEDFGLQLVDFYMDAHETADSILNSWEGALLRMKAQCSLQPLVVFDTVTFDGLLKR